MPAVRKRAVVVVNVMGMKVVGGQVPLIQLEAASFAVRLSGRVVLPFVMPAEAAERTQPRLKPRWSLTMLVKVKVARIGEPARVNGVPLTTAAASLANVSTPGLT